ncbi:MAG: hypothetical protein G01um10148_166 [Parcubacteria group bacterium Gr01-1014_8]|nr:MAG: hypothetical protein G01um10148_166 [Parcubacteria group bacterium Gr01-1014_8]
MMAHEDIVSNATPDDIPHSRAILEGEDLRKIANEPDYGYPIFEDESGRKFYLVLDKPVRQFFTSLLLEKAINQCPVVYDKVRGNFYSMAAPERGQRQPSATEIDVAESDMFILAVVFGIGDRGLHVLQNYSISDGQIYNFDIPGNFEFLIDVAGTPSDTVGSRYTWLTDDQKKLVKNKARKMLREFDGPQGTEMLHRLYTYALRCGQEAKQHSSSDYVATPERLATHNSYSERLRTGVDFKITNQVRTTRDIHDALVRRLQYVLSL